MGDHVLPQPSPMRSHTDLIYGFHWFALKIVFFATYTHIEFIEVSRLKENNYHVFLGQVVIQVQAYRTKMNKMSKLYRYPYPP